MTGVLYHDGTIIGSAVDYITATAQVGVRERRLYRLGERLVSEAVDAGNEPRRRTTLGYDMLECGGVSVGSRADGSILRISGAGASSACNETLRYADNVSRIDLQTTVRFARDVPRLARAHAEELQRVQRQRKRTITARLERTFGRGDTLYVGSRSSNYLGRVYDKYRESKEPEYLRCWRYEVECKGDGAAAAARLVSTAKDGSAAIAAGVSHWYRSRGITPRYRPELDVEFGPIGATTSDADRQLTWLARAIGPVVRRLAMRYGERAIVDLLFARCTPRDMEAIVKEVDPQLAAYDAWTIASES